MLIRFDGSVAADSTRRALIVYYRSRWTRNYNSRFVKRAFALLLQGAALGNISAMSFLGLLYGDGWGVAEDYTKAVYWLQKAAAANHPLAIYNLAIAYDNGFGVSQSHCKAFQLFMRAAKIGYADAMQSVGNMYERGEGVEKNGVKARFWYKKGAIAGHPTAMFDVGRCYMRGIGGSIQLPAARYWLEAASAAGHLRALLALGNYFARLSPPAWNEAFTWYERAIEEGSTEVCAMTLYQLGKLALQGISIPGRSSKALDYFQWAAKLGYQKAALQVALLMGESF